MTDRYAVIGNPIAQSKSPALHAAFARQSGHDLTYEAILATEQTFESVVRAFIRDGGKGMNVTAPFKLLAARLADRLTERARAAQAVNTLCFEPDGILGDNTDGVGLVGDIRDRLGFAIAGRTVLVIGAGGAARGILLPLMQAGPASLLLVNRTASRAEALLADMDLPGTLEAGPLSAATGRSFDLAIHATSAGLAGAGAPLVGNRYTADSLAYDLAYAAKPSAFLLQAQDRGAARISDGLGMLVGQAAESYLLWRGVRPDVQPVLRQLRLA